MHVDGSSTNHLTVQNKTLVTQRFLFWRMIELEVNALQRYDVEMKRKIDDGWQVIGRTKSQGELNPCFFCSPNAPKFRGGWQILLTDGREVTVGPDCGKTHLGDRFTIDRRVIEWREERETIQLKKDAWLSLQGELLSVVAQIRSHEGLRRLNAIKTETLQLGNRARKYLDAVSNGDVRGVPTFRIFENGGPIREAKTVETQLKALTKFPSDKLKPEIRELERAVSTHNGLIESYKQGILAFGTDQVSRLNLEMPEVQWVRDGNSLIIQRITDSLRRTLLLPDDLELPPYPLPFGEAGIKFV